MNKHILLVMKWQNDKDSVTQQELIDNRESAYAYAADAADAAADADAAVYAADAADAAADAADAAADAAAYAAYAAYTAADAAYTAAEKWVSKYFERSGENKQNYIDALNTDNKPVYTQTMCDAGELPSVGMECVVFMSRKDKSGESGFIEFKNEQGLLFRYKKNGLCDYYSLDDGSHFKPLTPPIELIDGEAYQFDYCSHTHNGVYVSNMKRLYHINGFISASVCTNIKLLTVKDEE